MVSASNAVALVFEFHSSEYRIPLLMVMSGIEVAGLVLGGIPLIISGEHLALCVVKRSYLGLYLHETERQVSHCQCCLHSWR